MWNAWLRGAYGRRGGTKRSLSWIELWDGRVGVVLAVNGTLKEPDTIALHRFSELVMSKLNQGVRHRCDK